MKLRRLKDLYINQLEYLFSPPGLPLVAKAGSSSPPTTTILVRGEAGAGKTTLALALAHSIARDRKGALLVLNTETAPVEVDVKAASLQIQRKLVLAWPSRSKARKGTILVQHIALAAAPEELDPEAESSARPGMLDVLWEMLRIYSDEDPARTPLAAVMIDGMLLSERDDNTGPTRSDTAAFLQALETRGISTVIVEESAPKQTSWLPFVVDLVFELQFNLAEDTRKLVRQLVCRKSRYTPAFAGPHEYDLDEDSVLSVWPDPLDIDPEILREVSGAGEACIFWPTTEENTCWIWHGAGLVCAEVSNKWDLVLAMSENFSSLPITIYPTEDLPTEDVDLLQPPDRGGAYSLVWRLFHTTQQHRRAAVVIHDLDLLLARSQSPVLFFRAIRALLRGGLLVGVRGNSDEIRKLQPFSASSPRFHKSAGEMKMRERDSLGTERWLPQASILEQLTVEEHGQLTDQSDFSELVVRLISPATADSSVIPLLKALQTFAKQARPKQAPYIRPPVSLLALECLRLFDRLGGNIRDYRVIINSLDKADPRVSTQRALLWYLSGNDWQAGHSFIPSGGLHTPLDRIIWTTLCARYTGSHAAAQWLHDVSIAPDAPLHARRLAASASARFHIQRDELAEARACIDAVAAGLDPWLTDRWHAEIAIEAEDESIVASGQQMLSALAVDQIVPANHQAEIFFNLALLEERRKNFAEAQAACSRALTRNPALESTIQRLRTRLQTPRAVERG